MLFTKKPKNFNPSFEVVGLFLQNDDKFLILQRQDYKPEGGTWGLPSGKIENETIEEAMIREAEEETGKILLNKHLSFFKTVYVQYDAYSFVYHMFSYKINDEQITISPEEHKGYKFVTPKEALRMNLIQDVDICIEIFYKLQPKAT